MGDSVNQEERLTVVERVHRDADLTAQQQTFRHDTLTLGWEDRSHAHGRRRTDAGVEFGTSLPRGTMLADGDRLVLDDEGLVVTVVEREERVFVISPRSPQEWALYAYHIGNRHQPVMITNESLVCPDAPGVEQLLQHHRIPYVRAMRPFTPAAAMSGHQH